MNTFNTPPFGIEFLVDADRHRIVKRDGWWCLYCPVRGTDHIIFNQSFWMICLAMRCSCPHLNDQLHLLHS